MKKLFEKLVAVTNQMVAEEGYRTSISYETPLCWTALAMFWAEHPAPFKGVFFEALHHIAAGVYPRKIMRYTQRFKILSLVEEAILACDQALEQWQDMLEYSEPRLYLATSEEESPFTRLWKSQVLFNAARNRFLLLTSTLGRYKDDAVPQLEGSWLIRASEHGLETFESVVKRLAPDFPGWPLDTCLSEENFFAALQDACGVDFSKHPEAFDIAYDLIDEKRCGAYYRVLFKYEDIPEGVVGLIWPNPDEMKKDLRTQFRWLCSATPWVQPILGYDTSAETVCKSWAYKQLLRWREDGSIKFTRKMAGNLMLIGEGIHPYTSRQNQKAKKSTVA